MTDFLPAVLPAAAVPYVLLAAGLAVLALCGNWLVSGCVVLARFFRVGTFAIGLTVVAFGTSAPELFISVGAGLRGAHDIALGNVVGSNIANIGAILGLVALIATVPVPGGAPVFDLAVMLGVTGLLLLLGLDGAIGRAEGALLLAVLAGYTVLSLVRQKRRQAGLQTAATERPSAMRMAAGFLVVLVSLAGLYLGSDWFVAGAREIAAMWGVSDRVIAVSVVAVGTSSPELFASLAAVFRREGELSIGNIIGSNLFNIGGVLGLTALVSPLTVGERGLFLSDMAWLLGFSGLLALALLPVSRARVSRAEGGILLALFAGYMVLVYRG